MNPSRIRRPVFALALAMVVAANVWAQPGPRKPEAQIEAMQKLDYMVGDWKGEGWMDFGTSRVTFRGSELVQKKLDGTVLQVEGTFFAQIGTSEVPVHTTLGVIHYDPQSKSYRFASWLATGSSGEREIERTADGWSWELKSPRGTTRYTMRLTETGEWLEIGERSKDGEPWTKFFEMRLKK